MISPETKYQLSTAGYEQAEKDFWDSFCDWNYKENKANRESYPEAFRNWDCEYIRPTHQIKPKTSNSTSNLFRGNPSLRVIEAAYFDFRDVNTGDGHRYTFTGCTSLERIEDVNLQPCGYVSTFFGCEKLKTIDMLHSNIDTEYKQTFWYCYELENLTIKGEIGTNLFGVQDCPKLSHDSLMSIINALVNYKEIEGDNLGTHTITLCELHKNTLSEEEQKMIKDKGWNPDWRPWIPPEEREQE